MNTNQNLLDLINKPEESLKENKKLYEFFVQLITESIHLYNVLPFEERTTINNEYGYVALHPIFHVTEAQMLMQNLFLPQQFNHSTRIKTLTERYKKMLDLYIRGKQYGKIKDTYSLESSAQRKTNLLQSIMPFGYPMKVNSFVMAGPSRVPVIVTIKDNQKKEDENDEIMDSFKKMMADSETSYNNKAPPVTIPAFVPPPSPTVPPASKLKIDNKYHFMNNLSATSSEDVNPKSSNSTDSSEGSIVKLSGGSIKKYYFRKLYK